ncbi:MAG: M56 family metallopeptidase [Planctomycetaceae bacterium]
MNAIVSSSVVERLGWVLVHSIWQFAVIALVAKVLDVVLRRASAATRYATFLLTFSALAIAPVATWVCLPSAARREAAPLPQSIGALDPWAGVEHEAISFPTAAATSREPPLGAPAVEPSPEWPERVAAWSSGVSGRLRPLFPAIVGAWLLGVFVFSLRPAVGWWTVQRLRRSGISAVPDALQSSLRMLAGRLRLRRAVTLCQSTLVVVPLAAGWLRPIILLPVSVVQGLPVSQLEAIFAHELAHIRRHDYLINLFQTLVETLCFYHPAVWWLSGRVRGERENCCDDMAVSLLGSRLDYGRALLALEELRGRELAIALAATGGSLVERIERLIGGRPSAVRAGRNGFGLFALLPATLLVAGLWAGAAALDDKDASTRDAKSSQDASKPGARDAADDGRPGDAKERSLDIIIAAHVLLWGDEIVSWEQIDERLRAMRKDGGRPISATFHVTQAAVVGGAWSVHQAAIHELRDVLRAPGEVSLRWLSYRAAQRYDAISRPADLASNAEQVRTGVVRSASGRPVSVATVVLIPEKAPPVPVMLQSDLSLRDPLDEVWARTDKEGHFQIAAPETGYRLAAISPLGFALAPVPKPGEPAEITLEPLAEMEVKSADQSRQNLSFHIALPGFPLALQGLPETCPGFALWEVAIDGLPQSIRVPPGKVSVSRELELSGGLLAEIPFVTMDLKPGERNKLSIPGADDEILSQPFRFPRVPNGVFPLPSRKAVSSLSNPTEVNCNEAPLENILRYLAEYHGISIRPDTESLAAAKIDLDDIPVTLHRNGVSFHWVLKQVLGPANLGYFVDDDGLVVMTREKAAAAAARANAPAKRESRRDGGAIDRLRPDRDPAVPQKLLAKLNEPADVDFVDTPLETALHYLSEYLGIAIRRDNESLATAKIDLDEIPVTVALQGVSWNTVLRVMLEPQNLGHYADGDGLVVTTREKAAAAAARANAPLKVESKERVTEMFKLQGTWIAVFAADTGKEASKDEVKASKITLKISGNSFTLKTARIGKGAMRGTVKLAPERDPKSMDWLSVESVEDEMTNEGARALGDVTGIYRLDGDTLTFCYGRERPKEFKSGPDPKLEQRLYVFERQTPPALPGAAKDRSLDIIIAEHVILWDGQIVTWEQVEQGLRAIRKEKGEPIHPKFKFTNGASRLGKSDRLQAEVFKISRGLFDEMSFGSMSPRGSERYDAIHTAADLIPNPAHVRQGIVRTSAGRPVPVATVVLMPEKEVSSIVLQHDLSLRDPHDEIWARTDREGRFTIPAPDTGYLLAVLSPIGFASAPVPANGKTAEIIVAPRATIEIASADKSQQTLDFSIQLPELPDSSPGFQIYGLQIGQNAAVISVPPGRITIRRSFDLGNGRSVAIPAEVRKLKSGENWNVSLPRPDPNDLEKWKSLLP